jgi:hypothetical protein
VYELVGPPNDTIKRSTSETLVFIERRRSIGRGALIGGSVLAAAITPWALITGPLNFAVVPFFAIVGALGGAVVGAFVKVDQAKLFVELGDDGRVVRTEIIDLR